MVSLARLEQMNMNKEDIQKLDEAFLELLDPYAEYPLWCKIVESLNRRPQLEGIVEDWHKNPYARTND